MKSYDYYAYVYGGAVLCAECMPEGSEGAEEARPIFAGDEWDYIPVCEQCGAAHDYVTLTNEGGGEDG